MIGGRPDIAIIEAKEYLSGINALVVGDRNGIAHAAIVASGARLGSGQAVRCH